jgi:CheY-like chemotaxis protein/two-component sensor histidine kinase
MEGIGRLAGGIAHDFNNLLTAILGYTEMVLDQIGTDKPISADLAEIQNAADRAAALTRQLLAFSRKQTLHVTALDVNEIIETMRAMLQRVIGEDIAFRLSLAPGLKAVLADRVQLEQVVMNLVVNARDAMPSGGRLTIETGNVGQTVMLAVGDTGCGMDDETRARLFEPYFTTKEPGRGSGLGLATVYDVVTQCGGQISVTSGSGAGSTFKIYLPRATEPSAPPLTPMAPAAPSDGKTVLVVENEREVRDLIREILQLQNHVVLEAGDRDEALALSQQHAGPIDLMVVDVGIPPSFADEWVVRVRASRPEIKVLYVSGYLSDSASVDAPKLGPLLQKPFTVGSFTKAIGLVLSRTK